VGALPVENRDEVKRTNEIKTAIPLLDALDIKGKEISADALLTQRRFATYRVEKRQAHYHFTVKGNQPGLLEALKFYFQERGQPHFVEHTPPDHGRIETRKIWTTTELNAYLDFPHVGQAFVIERHVTEKKTGATSREIAYGLTRRTPPKPARNAFSRSIAGIGSSRTEAITFSMGTMMKTAVASAPATAQKTSPACGASPSA
jgi:predicted transposase YbfD/YdcC